MKINSIVAKAVQFAGVAYFEPIVCGTAYPAWQGNSGLTEHVVNADENLEYFPT
jgi:hypothetical protein